MTDPKDRDFIPSWSERRRNERRALKRATGSLTDPTVCEVCGNLADGEPGRCHLHFRATTDASRLSKSEIETLVAGQMLAVLRQQNMARETEMDVLATLARAWLDER
jgi:hypothetical protein